MTVRENLGVAACALLSVPVALGAYFLVDWLFHDWMRWIELGVFSAVVFGLLAYRVQADLRRPKCLATFIVLFGLHCTVFVHLLRSGVEIRTAWYVAIVAVETFVFGLILTGPGGARDGESGEADDSR